MRWDYREGLLGRFIVIQKYKIFLLKIYTENSRLINSKSHLNILEKYLVKYLFFMLQVIFHFFQLSELHLNFYLFIHASFHVLFFYYTLLFSLPYTYQAAFSFQCSQIWDYANPFHNMRLFSCVLSNCSLFILYLKTIL